MTRSEILVIEVIKKLGGCPKCKKPLMFNISLQSFVCKCRILSIPQLSIWECSGDEHALMKMIENAYDEAKAAPGKWDGLNSTQQAFLFFLDEQRCHRCGGMFDISSVDPLKLQCLCGIEILGMELFGLEGAYRIPFLLRREALIHKGTHKKCTVCGGKGIVGVWSGTPCLKCSGTGAMEIFNCNGLCFECLNRFPKKCALCEGTGNLQTWIEKTQG